MNFPLYRKYSNGKSYFKITSENEFDELQITGNSFCIYIIKAKILPDRNYIDDLISNYYKNYLECSENEYISILEYCKTNLKET